MKRNRLRKKKMTRKKRSTPKRKLTSLEMTLSRCLPSQAQSTVRSRKMIIDMRPAAKGSMVTTHRRARKKTRSRTTTKKRACPQSTSLRPRKSLNRASTSRTAKTTETMLPFRRRASDKLFIPLLRQGQPSARRTRYLRCQQHGKK